MIVRVYTRYILFPCGEYFSIGVVFRWPFFALNMLYIPKLYDHVLFMSGSLYEQLLDIILLVLLCMKTGNKPRKSSPKSKRKTRMPA